MSKTIYFRETDPKTRKAKWIKIDGVKGNNSTIFIDKEKFEVQPFLDSPIFFVYKSTRNKRKSSRNLSRRNFDELIKSGKRFEYDLSEDDKLRLMQRK